VQDTLYRQGEYVTAGSPVVVLLPPDHLKVRFFVPETWLPRVRVGAPAQVSFDGGKQSADGHHQLYFHLGGVHAAGDLQPREPGQFGIHDRSAVCPGGRRGGAARPAGGCAIGALKLILIRMSAAGMNSSLMSGA
jgi:hypothetical protein